MLKDNTTRPRHRRTGHFVARNLFDRLEGFADLEARIAALPTERDRGDAFEVFAEAYLASQKLVGAEEVWPDDQVPIAVLNAHALPAKDMGADGVYKTWAGQYNAYQVKFRTGRSPLTWQELSTFMGLTDQVGERVLFTNCDDLPAVMNERIGFFCIRGTDLERLTKDDLEAIADWLRGSGFTPTRKEPRPHQSEALEAILGGLEEHDRVTAVMACATGKTLVSLWLAEQRRAKRILVLVPSLALIRQTLHEWLKETEWERPRFIAVCSDPTVTQGVEDSLIVHQRDLDFPVTTDVGEVRKFLVAPGNGVQIVFSTYQSAHVVGEACRGMNDFDLGIFDEAHKTAGREGAKFGFALQDRHVQIAKRVFLTATPRHYDVRKRDKEGDKALVYSMDDPETYGPLVQTLSFSEAAKRCIICNYKVIISVVTSDMINADLLSKGEVIVEGDVVRARTVANQIAIQKACQAHDLKKVFSFHRNVASARDFTGDTPSSIQTHLPDYATYHVNGGMPTARREKELRAFREADRAIMSNARCLTEGVDVPAVDVVAFLSPRKSKVDIVQAAGRAMRKREGKEAGYVLLPLFLETQENETIEEALARTGFEEAWDVLQAMQEQDAVLAEIIREMREEKGRLGGFDDSRLRERVEVLGPKVFLDVLRDAVSTALVDQLGLAWDQRYGELKRYKERFGDCNVPAVWGENPQLGSWVTFQRVKQRDGTLSADRKIRLDEIAFAWDARESAWESMFTELKRNKDEHGHCNISQGSKENPELGTWVATQRSVKNSGKLSAARKARLDELGFAWDPKDAAWESMLAALKRYKDAHGHCKVPENWGENPQLGIWVGTQRSRKKRRTLSAEQEAQLNTLGFIWDPSASVWETMFAELKRYKERFDHCNVPRKWRENPELDAWVVTQRSRKKRRTLSAEQEAQLNTLGFIWDPSASVWETMFAELKQLQGAVRSLQGS
jgi:superfamily II DNA or RNA helicase